MGAKATAMMARVARQDLKDGIVRSDGKGRCRVGEHELTVREA